MSIGEPSMDKAGGTTPEKKKEVKNNGQEVGRHAFEPHWKGTTYDDGGFDYEIRPINLGEEPREKLEIERRVAAGENQDDVENELSEEYISQQEEKLGVDRHGYVSNTGRVYTDLFAAERAETKYE